MNRYDIDRVFGPQKPLQNFQVERLQYLQQEFKTLAAVIIENTSSVPAQERALDFLEQAYYQAQIAAREPRSIATPDALRRTFRDIEERDDVVVRVWMNAKDFADILKFGRDVFDPETELSKVKQGIQGRLWITEIRIKRAIPEGYVLPVGSLEDDYDLDLSLDSGWKPDPTKLVRL